MSDIDIESSMIGFVAPGSQKEDKLFTICVQDIHKTLITTKLKNIKNNIL